MRAVPALERTLSALADPTRRSIGELLRKKRHRAGELAASLAVSAPALSRHLRILRQSRLVSNDGLAHDARVRIYSLRRDGLHALNDRIVHSLGDRPPTR
jgi:DNA-binding transcriptional ArsR family regulator